VSAAELLDVGSVIFLLVAALLSLAAGIGVVRFPDPLSRMHAATKPQILGLVCALVALGLQAENGATVAMLVPILAFQMLTAPVSAHMVGRAGYRTRHVRRDLLLRDELADAIEKAHADAARHDTEPDLPGLVTDEDHGTWRP
jgi:multicomponent Na+:H+ antiporter subunit G